MPVLLNGPYLEALIAKLKKQGPDRVAVNNHGRATSPEEAARLGIVPYIVYIRNDGWTLGAPVMFASCAENLWADIWAATWIVGEDTVTPFTNHSPHVWRGLS